MSKKQYQQDPMFKRLEQRKAGLSTSSSNGELTPEELEAQELEMMEEVLRRIEATKQQREEAEKNHDAAVEQDKAIVERKAEQEIYAKQDAILQVADSSNNWFQDLGDYIGNAVEGLQARNRLKDFYEKDGFYYKREKSLNDMAVSPIFNMVPDDPSVKSPLSNINFESSSPEAVAEVLTDVADKRANASGYDLGYKLNNLFGTFTKGLLYDTLTGAIQITKSIGTGELKRQQRAAGFYSALKGINSFDVAARDLLGQEAARKAGEDRATKIQKTLQETEKRLGEVYEETAEDRRETGWERFIDESIGLKRNDEFYAQQEAFKGVVGQLAAKLENRERLDFISDDDFEPVDNKMFNYVDDGKGIDMEIPMEKLSPDSESPVDALKLAYEENGRPLLDDNGAPVYIPKYSWADKLRAGNYTDLFTDKYLSDDLLQGIGSSLSFIAAGPAIGKAVGQAGKGLGKAASYGGKNLTTLGKSGTKMLADNSKMFEKSFSKISENLDAFKNSPAGKLADRASNSTSVAVAEAKTQQFLHTLANSYLMTNSESQMIGTETYRSVYREGILEQMGLDEDELRAKVQEANPEMNEAEIETLFNSIIGQEIHSFEKNNPKIVDAMVGYASASRALAVSINNANTAMNLNYGAYFGRTVSVSRLPKRSVFSPTSLGRGAFELLKESGQEAIEEGGVNNYAQLAAESIARGQVLGIQDFLENNAFSKEGMTDAMMGSITGAGQTAVMQTISSYEGQKAYREQQEVLKDISSVTSKSKEDIAKFFGTAMDSKALISFVEEIQTLNSEGKTEEAELLAKSLLVNKSIRAATNGLSGKFTEHLTSMMMDESLDAESKAVMQEAIEMNEMIADINDKHVNYVGRNKIMENRANNFVLEKKKQELVEKIIPALNKAKDEAIRKKARKSLSNVNMDASMSYEDLLNNQVATTTLSEEAKENVELRLARQQLAEIESSQDDLNTFYEDFGSEKGQRAYINAIKEARKEILAQQVTRETAQDTKNTITEQEGKIDGDINNKIDNKINDEVKPSSSTKVQTPPSKTTVAKQIKDVFSAEEFTSTVDEFVPASQETSIPSQSLDDTTVDNTNKETQENVSEEEELTPEEEKQQRFLRANTSLHAPIVRDANNEEQNRKVESFQNSIEKLLAVNPTMDFDGMIAGLRSSFGSRKTEQLFDLLAEAWEKANQEALGEIKTKVYNDNFGIPAGTFDNTAFTPGNAVNGIQGKSKVELPGNKPSPTIEEVTKSEETINSTNRVIGVDPITGEVDVIYEGYKISEPYVKVAMLGLDYELSQDGKSYETVSNEIIHTAFPGLHWDNFKVGDKVELRFKFDYLENPTNPMRVWKNPDSQEPISEDITTQEFVEMHFGKGTYTEIINKLKSPEGRREILSDPKNIEFLKHFPTSMVVGGKETELGINDNNWWNARNTALPIDKKTRKPLGARRDRLIKKARATNLKTRQAMLASPDLSVKMTVGERRSGFQNKLLPADASKFQSLVDAFKGNREAARKHISFAVVTSAVGLKANNKGTLKVGNQTVAFENIINWKDFYKQYGDATVGMVAMIKQVGKRADGTPLFSVHHVVNNHKQMSEQFQVYSNIRKELAAIAKRLTLGNYTDSILEASDKLIAKNLKDKFGIQLTSISLSEKFLNFYPRYSKKNDSTQNQVKQDYDIGSASTKAAENIPDMRGVRNVNEFLNKVKDGTVASTNYQDILLDHIHTQYIFTEITQEGKESVWSSESQPVISFDNSHLDLATQNQIDEAVEQNVETVETLEKEIKENIEALNLLKKALEKETQERRKKGISTQIEDIRKKLRTLEQKKKIKEAAESTSKEIKAKNTRKPTTHDILDINENVLFSALQKIDLGKPFKKSNVIALMEESFNELVEYTRENGTAEELSFLIMNKNTVLGKSKYDGSAVEALDSLFKLQQGEEFNLDSENIKDQTKESYENDIKTSLSDRVKILFSGIRDARTSPDGFAGMQAYLPFPQSTDAIQQVLAEAKNNTFEEISRVINEKINLNPKEFMFYREMLNRLEKLNKEDNTLLNEILYSLYQPKVEMAFIRYSVNDSGEFTLQKYDANSRSPEIAIKQKWGEYLKSSSLVSKFEEGLYKINEDTAEKVYQLYDDIYKMIEEDGIVNVSKVDEFLKLFGVHLTPGVLEALGNNAFNNSNLSLYTKGTEKDEETGVEKLTGEVYGILASNQLIQLLKKNLDKALMQQSLGKLVGVNNNMDNKAIKALLDKHPKISKEYYNLKKKNERLEFLKNQIKEGNLPSQGVKLAFSERFVYDKTEQAGFNILTTETRNALNNLAVANNAMTYTPKSSMRIAKKPINYFQQPKRITNILEKLKSDPDFMEKMSNLDINQGSFLLEILKSNPELKESLDVINASLESLKRAGAKSRDDMEIQKLSDKDAFVTLFGMFAHTDGKIDNEEYSQRDIKLRKATMSFPTLSDSSQVPLMATAVVDIRLENFKGEASELGGLTDDFLDFFADKMVKGDFHRISSYLKAVRLQEVGAALVRGEEVHLSLMEEAMTYLEETYPDKNLTEISLRDLGKLLDNKVNIKGHNAGAVFIGSIPSLNTLLLTTKDINGNEVRLPLIEVFKHYGTEGQLYRDNVENFFNDFRAEINEELQRNIEHEVSQYISEDGTTGQFIEDDIYLNGRLRFMDQKYLELKSGVSKLQLARLVAHDYVINTFLAQRDIQNIFAGDVANYFSDRMGENLDLGLPTVDISDIIDHYYPELADRKEEIMKSKDIPGFMEALQEQYPNLLAARSLSLVPVNTRAEIIAPIAEKKIAQMFKGVQNNLSKRLKSLISPGSQFPDSKGNRKYFQILLSDVDSASEVIQSIINYSYPGKYEGLKAKLDEFKEIDNIYKTERLDSQNKRYNELFKEFEKEIPNVVAYLKTASTDAQEYTTWRDNLRQLKEQSRLTVEEFNAITTKFEAQDKDLRELGHIREENRWQESESELKRKSIFQPSKPLYSGLHTENVNGYNLSRDIYIKSSSFPLTPEMTEKFPKLEAMRKNLENFEGGDQNVTVRASYDSAIKVGSVNNSLSVSELYREHPNLDLVEQSTLELDRENFYIQQDKPFDADKTEVGLATQFEKILLGDGMNKITEAVFPNLFDPHLLDLFGIKASENNMLTGPQLKEMYDKVYERDQKLHTQELFRKFGIKSFEDINKGTPAAMEKIVDILNQRLDNKQDKKALELIYTVGDDIKQYTKAEIMAEGLEPTKATLKLPLYMMPNSQKFESVLNSVINKSNINLKAVGFASPVGSQEGFDFKGFEGSTSLASLKERGFITTKNFDPRKGLQATTVIDKDGKEVLQSAQVFISNKFKVRNEKTGKIETLNLENYLNEDGQLDLPEDILTMFSFRIPTSAHQSGVNIEIAGFLPDSAADLMIVPKDHTAQIGEDYDIDVRYVYNYNLVQKEDGTVKKIEVSDIIDVVETYEELRDNYDKSLEDAMDKLIKSKRVSGITKMHKGKLTELAIAISSLENFDKKGLFSEYYNVDEDGGENPEAITKLQLTERIEELKRDISSEITSFDFDNISLEQEIFDFVQELSVQFEDNLDLRESFHKYLTKTLAQRRMKSVLQNNITSLYKSVFSSVAPEVQNLISKVLSTDNAESTANAMDEKLSAAQDSNIFNIYSPTIQRKVLKAGAYGKIGIGEHSNAVTMNSLFQQSDYSHRIVEEYSEEGEVIPYSIQLGPNLVFDGILGKLEVNGTRVSELGMESQNSSTDNQKLEIMGRRNENPQTMSVLKILQANGIDNDGIKVNGQKMSYSSLFLNQPILRRYSELMEKFSSETDENFGNADALTEEILMKEFGEGLEGHWAMSKQGPIEGILSFEAEKEAGTRLSTARLWDNLVLDSSNKLDQWYVYSSFKKLKGAAKKYNELQQFINIEKNGMGISYFNTIETMDKLVELATNKNGDITNQDKMIGDVVTLQHEDGSFDEKAKKLVAEGYIRVKDQKFDTIFIKPSNHYSHKIVNSITLGYNLYNSLFPYDQSTIEEQIKEILVSTNTTPGSRAETEMKYSIISGLKDYVYANSKALFDNDLNGHTDRLFFDTKENSSLATYLADLQKDENFKNMFKGPFFKDLQFETNQGTHPSLIKFNNSDLSDLNSLNIYNTLSKYLDSNRPLKNFNGQPYTEGDLLRDLLRYSLIADQGNGAIGFRQHLPIEVFEMYGVTDKVRNDVDPENLIKQSIIYNGIYKALESLLGNKITPDGIIKNSSSLPKATIKMTVELLNAQLAASQDKHGTILVANNGDIKITDYNGEDFNSSFVKQYLQHNPKDVRNIGKFRRASTEYGVVMAPDKGMKEILKRNGISKEDISDLQFFISDVGLPFVQLSDTDGNLMLFERTADNQYERIDILGVFGFNEYKTGETKSKSKVRKNTSATEKSYNIPITFESSSRYIDNTTLSDITKNILNDRNNPYSALMQLVAPTINFDNVQIVVGETMQGKAEYNPKLQKIWISPEYLRTEPTSAQIYATIAEETLHHVTSTTFAEYINITGLNSNGTLEYHPVVKDGVPVSVPSQLQTLITIYNKAFTHIAKKQGSEELWNRISAVSNSEISAQDRENQEAAYRLSSIHEFIAGIFIKDESFAKEMAVTPYLESGKSFLQKFSTSLESFFNRLLPTKRKDTVSAAVANNLHQFLEFHHEEGMKPKKEGTKSTDKKRPNGTITKGTKIIEESGTDDPPPPSENTFRTRIDQFEYSYNPDTKEVIHHSNKGDRIETNETQVNKVLAKYAKAVGLETKSFNRQDYVNIDGKILNIENGNQVTNPDIVKLFNPTVEGTTVTEKKKTTKKVPVQKGKFSYNGITIDTNFQLGDQQVEALEKAIDYVEKDGANPFFTIEGSAGTGKTTIIGYLQKYLEAKSPNRGPVISYLAPTHAATAQLAKTTVALGNKNMPSTIASSYYRDRNSQELKFTKKMNISPYADNIFVVDESSMVANGDLREFIELVDSIGGKIIYMGDANQIPSPDESAINAKGQIVMNDAFGDDNSVILTKVYRQDSSDLLRNLDKIKDNVAFDPVLDIRDNDGTLAVVSGKDYFKAVRDAYKEDPDKVIYIAYTNPAVEKFNAEMKLALTGTKDLLIGDKIVGYVGSGTKQISKGNIANSIHYIIKKVEQVNKNSAIFNIEADSKLLEELVDSGVEDISKVARTKYVQLGAKDSITLPNVTEEMMANASKEIGVELYIIYEQLYKIYNGKFNPSTYPKQLQLEQKLEDYLGKFDFGGTYSYNPNTRTLEKGRSIQLPNNKSKSAAFAELFTVHKGIDFGYGVTAHKSQGMTIDKAFVDLDNISAKKYDTEIVNKKGEVLNMEKNALFYVAMSRARNNVTVQDSVRIAVTDAEGNVTNEKALKNAITQVPTEDAPYKYEGERRKLGDSMFSPSIANEANREGINLKGLTTFVDLKKKC